MWEAIIGAVIAGVSALFRGSANRGNNLSALYQFWNPLFGHNTWGSNFERWLWGKKNRRNVRRATNLTEDLSNGQRNIWEEFIEVMKLDNNFPPYAVLKYYFPMMPDDLHFDGDGCNLNAQLEHIPSEINLDYYTGDNNLFTPDGLPNNTNTGNTGNDINIFGVSLNDITNNNPLSANYSNDTNNSNIEKNSFVPLIFVAIGAFFIINKLVKN